MKSGRGFLDDSQSLSDENADWNNTSLFNLTQDFAVNNIFKHFTVAYNSSIVDIILAYAVCPRENRRK